MMFYHFLFFGFFVSNFPTGLLSQTTQQMFVNNATPLHIYKYIMQKSIFGILSVYGHVHRNVKLAPHNITLLLLFHSCCKHKAD